jgi:hypothetical protein
MSDVDEDIAQGYYRLVISVGKKWSELREAEPAFSTCKPNVGGGGRKGRGLTQGEGAKAG